MLKLFRKYTKTWEQTICRRVSDGTYWVASSNGHAHAMSALFSCANKFYFRRIHLFPKGYITSYDDIWEFNNGDLFDIVGKSSVYAERNAWKKHLENY